MLIRKIQKNKKNQIYKKKKKLRDIPPSLSLSPLSRQPPSSSHLRYHLPKPTTLHIDLPLFKPKLLPPPEPFSPQHLKTQTNLIFFLLPPAVSFLGHSLSLDTVALLPLSFAKTRENLLSLFPRSSLFNWP